MRRLAVIALGVLLALGASAAGQVHAADIAPAEQLIFQDDHLIGVHPPAVLRYRLEETGLEPAARHGELQLTLHARSDGGCCAVAAEERGGETFGPMPPVDEAKSNPVILYFLERDIRQMQTLTGGLSNYFRRLIRLSLADEASVTDTTVLYAGRRVPAREVRVTPYAHDPRVAQFGPLAGKAYVFVMAKDVPGGVFKIHTSVAGNGGKTPPVAETSLTLIEPAVANADGGHVQSGN